MTKPAKSKSISATSNEAEKTDFFIGSPKTDPRDVSGRLYNQLSRLLDDMERGGDSSVYERIRKVLDAKRETDATLRTRIEDALAAGPTMTTRERVGALIAIGRIQTIFTILRKNTDERGEGERGSAVRKFSKAFASPNGAGRRSSGRRGASGGNTTGDPGLASLLADDDADDFGSDDEPENPF